MSGANDDGREAEFRRLAEKWLADTGHISNIQTKIDRPEYQAIVAMGPAAVPLMLRRLAVEPGEDWYPALAIITGASPIKTGFGVTKLMARAWLQWGRDHGYDV